MSTVNPMEMPMHETLPSIHVTRPVSPQLDIEDRVPPSHALRELRLPCASIQLYGLPRRCRSPGYSDELLI